MAFREKLRSYETREALRCRASYRRNREILATLNVPIKIGEASPAGYTQRIVAQWSSKHQVA